MKSAKSKPPAPPKSPKSGIPKHQHSVAATAAEVSVGAVAGAALGAIAGPVGAVAGAIVGSAAGAVAALAMDRAGDAASAHDEKLDEQIGVTSGSLGAAGLKHPPAKVGAYSSASAGGGSSRTSTPPAEGPMSEGDD